jgi:hypothetical protein
MLQPRIEGRGVNPGYACAALPSQNPWSARASVRIILAGNKSGRSQVFTVILGFETNPARMRSRKKESEDFSVVPCARTPCKWLNRLCRLAV